MPPHRFCTCKVLKVIIPYLLAIIMRCAMTQPLTNDQTCIILRRWARHFLTSLAKPSGYIVIVSIIARIITVYVGTYAIFEARHDRRANRALFERSTFMTMVASGNRGNFIAAMKTFGPLQTMKVPRDPDPFDPRTWVKEESPNKEALRTWAVSFFPHCTVDACGQPTSSLVNPTFHRI